MSIVNFDNYDIAKAHTTLNIINLLYWEKIAYKDSLPRPSIKNTVIYKL